MLLRDSDQSIMPGRVREKSNLIGSSGEIFTKAAVISLAVFKSAVFRFVKPHDSANLYICVSSGTINRAGDIPSQQPGSIESHLTIQRRYNNSLLHALLPRGSASNLHGRPDLSTSTHFAKVSIMS